MVLRRGIAAVGMAVLLLGNSPLRGQLSAGIIPTPREWELRSSSFKITSQTRVVLGEGTEDDDETSVALLLDELRSFKDYSLRIVREQSLRKLSDNFIFIGTPSSPTGRELLRHRSAQFLPSMRAEGYWLDVDSAGIIILGETARGRFYGIASLIQLIRHEKKRLVVKGIRIRDWPRMGFRGITDDISRGQVSTLEHFKSIIRFLARHKLNMYCLYIEDVFSFSRHPQIGRGRGALTAREIQELDRFARTHHVQLVPIFQTLGHWENILSIPGYAQFAEFPGAHTLNLADERIYTLLDEMIRELARVFSSPFFHIGADETSDVGYGGSRNLVRQNGLASTLANHYKRVCALVRKYKKKPMIYGDMLLENPDILPLLPRDLIVVDWQYDAKLEYPSAQFFKQANIPFVVSPTVGNYTGPFPDYARSIVNIRNFAEAAASNGALGMLTSAWNDFGGEALRELNAYGYAWSAECAWAQSPAEVSVFNDLFFEHYFGTKEAAGKTQLAYVLLSSNRVTWHELWRHPFLPPPSSSPTPTQIQAIKTVHDLVTRLLSDAQKLAPHRIDPIEHLQFVADLTLWYVHKTETAERIRLLSRETSATRKDSVLHHAIGWCTIIIHQLDSLQERFKTLWLRHNRPEGLELLLQRYERQKSYWLEKKQELEQGIWWSEPALTGQWIFHPQAHPFSPDTTLSQVQHVTFRGEFSIASRPLRAVVQLIAFTHARLWINGILVGERSARPSLSLIVEHQRVGFWDVTSHIKEGSNIIAVEAHAYRTGESAGVNVYGEITLPDSIMTLQSDERWMVADSTDLRDGRWHHAVKQQFPQAIIRPNFTTGRPSWIER